MTFEALRILSEPLESILNLGEAAKRQAVDSVRGYIYQFHQAVAAWMELRQDEDLYVELAEDLARYSAADKSWIIGEIKHEDRALTLNTTSVTRAIERLFALQLENPGRTIRMELISIGLIKPERASPLKNGRAALEVWRDAANGGPLHGLREALIDRFPEGPLSDFLLSADDSELRDRIFRQLDILDGAESEAEISETNENRLRELYREIVPGALAPRSAYAYLLWYVIRTTLRSPSRRLDRHQLRVCMVRALNIASTPVPAPTEMERFSRFQVRRFVSEADDLMVAPPPGNLAEPISDLVQRLASNQVDLNQVVASAEALYGEAEERQARFKRAVAETGRRYAIATAIAAALAAYASSLLRNMAQAEAFYKKGLAALTDQVIETRLSYAIGVINALREVGARAAAISWIDDSYPFLFCDPNYEATVTRILNGDAPQAEESTFPHIIELHVRVLLAYALVLSDENKLEEAAATANKAMLLAKAAGDVAVITDTKFLAADLARRMNLSEAAAAELEDIVRYAEGDARIDRIAAFALGSLAHSWMAAGRPRRAIDCLEQALERIDKADPEDIVASGIFHGDLAKALYRAGDNNRASAEAVLSLLHLTTRHPRCESYALRTFGDILMDRGAIDEAGEVYRSAVAVAEQIPNQHCLAMAKIGLGRWELMFGAVQIARREFAKARSNLSDQDLDLLAECAAGLALCNQLTNEVQPNHDLATALALVEDDRLSLYAKSWISASAMAINHAAHVPNSTDKGNQLLELAVEQAELLLLPSIYVQLATRLSVT